MTEYSCGAIVMKLVFINSGYLMTKSIQVASTFLLIFLFSMEGYTEVEFEYGGFVDNDLRER